MTVWDGGGQVKTFAAKMINQVCDVCGAKEAPFGYVDVRTHKTASARLEHIRWFCWAHEGKGEAIIAPRRE